MPFIIIFNIIICAVMFGVLAVIMGAFVASRDNKKRTGERAEKTQLKIEKVKTIAYLVFGCVLILMILVNLII